MSSGTPGRTGVWLVGARGSVATAAVCGAAALHLRLVEPVGCVTGRPEFARSGLPAYGSLVFGGHDLTGIAVEKRAEQLTDAGVLPRGLVDRVRDELAGVEAELRPGYAPGSGEPQSAAVTRLVADLVGFRARLGLDRVVVINVSAADPPVTVVPELETPSAVDTALAGGAVGLLPPSGLYAWAAYTAGCPYVDFTPSAGARLRAVMGLARDRGLPWAGTAGKTGESLVKATLAPMFAARSLDVRSWSSVSLDGGSSGSRPPAPGVAGALGRRVAGPSHVHHVPDLGEWTTGWDMVSFVGFLGARMSLQFTLTGSESALAAPLVLDLARLVARAHQVGLSGPLGELGFFFDDPVAASTHSVEAQFVELCMWAGGLGR